MRSVLRVLVASLIASCVASGLSAQTSLGVHAGASIATLGGSDVGSADARTGLSFGASVTFPMQGNLGIQIGAGYVQKGATESAEGVQVEFALDYIEMPVLLRIAVPTTGNISPHFLVGPAVSFKAKCDASVAGGGASVSVSCADADAPIKSIDIGGMAGAGLEIATSGSLSVTLDAFFNLGFSSIDDSTVGDDIKNRAWSILAGVAFPIG